MLRVGYSYSAPLAAMSFFLNTTHSPPFRLEVATAIADVKCGEKSKLASVANLLSKTTEDQLQVRYSNTFNEIAQIERSALPRAQRVVKSAAHVPE
jgi:hypothetical protein